jgi:hypothetical protein
MGFRGLDSWAHFALVFFWGGGRWQFGIGCELAHRFVCGARRGRLALGKEMVYQIHSSEDPGKMEKNSRIRVCSCFVCFIWGGWVDDAENQSNNHLAVLA